ncbi:hypothetical protein ACIBBG_16415 [Micromonospora chersina]|uniref:hypothetical protein n=1 Tax=Micromonospora chersina TaxID=47854 RepID=UPI003789438E
MARIRSIKPEFWSSPGQQQCRDPYARLLFIAMWNWADDTGRGTANARELAGFAFPHDEELSSADIRRMLGEIRRAFGVVFYEVGGRPYYLIPSWDRHQKIDKRSGARHPGPDAGNPWDPDPDPNQATPAEQAQQPDSEKFAESSAEPAESTPSPRRMPGAGTGEQGNRGTGEETPPPLASLDGGGGGGEPDDTIEGEIVDAPVALAVVPDLPDPDPVNAGQITKQWIDHCKAHNVKLTGQVIKRYGAGIKRALDEGFEHPLIRRALMDMLADRVASRPSLLDTYLIRAQQGPELPPRRASRTEASMARTGQPSPTAALIRDALTRPA